MTNPLDIIGTIPENASQAEIIAAWRDFRSTCRPAECDHSQPCWVENPYEATANQFGRAARCSGCGGRIR